MKLSTIFDFNKIQFDKENEVILMTSLKAPKIKEDKSRPPLNLSLVLDVSGSMGGRKLHNLKDSVTKLIQQLSDKDTVGIVTFTDYIEEVFPSCKMSPKNKAKALSEVNNLSSKFMTNMSGGMFKGFEQLKKADLKKGTVHRMLLFTDGHANVGLNTQEQFSEMVKTQIGESNITISTFGYGEDHDDNILKNIAEMGKGNFYFIENVEDMAKTFARELGGLLSCYAQNITLELILKDKSGELIDVLNDFSVHSDSESHAKIDLDDIYSEEEKHILVKMKLNPVTKAVTQRKNSIVDIKVTYNDMTSKGKTKGILEKAKIYFVKKEKIQKEIEVEVEAQLAIIKLAEAHKKAREYADKGDYISAQNCYVDVRGCIGELGTKGPAGEAYAESLTSSTSYAINNLTASNYTKGAGMKLNSMCRGLSTGRLTDDELGGLYGNSTQKEMEKEFTSGTVQVDNSSPISSGDIAFNINTTSNTCHTAITSPDDFKNTTVASTDSNTNKKSKLSKRRKGR